MTQNTSGPGDPTGGDPNSPPPGSAQPDASQTPPPPKKKKRRWLLKSFIGLVVLIVLLVLLAPTILSMGFVRGIVVDKINGSALNGKLQIKDWSFGWLSGVHIQGVELTDEDNIHLLSISKIDSPISLVRAITGTIDLGDATIDGVDFNAVIDEKGQINFAKAIKPSNTPPSNEPSKLPNVKGTIHLTHVIGTLKDEGHNVTLNLPQSSPLNVTVGIPDINQPITNAIDVGVQVGQSDLIAVKVNGTVSAIKNNLVDVQNLAADQTVELSQGDLATVTQLLHAISPKTQLNLAGKLDGKIEAKVATLNNVAANGRINLANVSAGGGMLAGDTVAYKQIQLSLSAAAASPTVKLDLPITMTPTTGGQADQINVHVNVPQDSIGQTADVFKAIFAQLMKSPAGGVTKTQIAGAGDVKLSADVNVANLVGQMPHMMHLEQGMSLTSGQLTHETTVTLANGQAVIASTTQLKDFGGTNAGKAVHLQDITASAGATAVGGDHPDVRDVKIGLQSAFATVSGGGPSLGKLQIQASSDLNNLQQQVGQFIDLESAFHAAQGSHMSLAGTIGGGVHTDGDLTADDSMIAVGADLNAKGVSVDVPGRRKIQEPNLAATVSANLHHTSARFVEAAKDVNVSVQSPAIQFAANGDAQLGDKFGVSFAITQGKIDTRLVQEELGGALSMFVPPPQAGQPETLVQKIADNSVRVASGNVMIAGKGRFDQTAFGFEEPLAITINPTDLTVADEMGTVQTYHVPAVAVGISGNGASNSQGVTEVKNLSLTATIGDANSPLLAANVGADLTVSKSSDPGASNMSAQRIELTRLDGDLPALQSTFGPLLPLLGGSSPTPGQSSLVQMISENTVACTSGKLSGSMLASSDGKTITIDKPLTVTISDFTLQQKQASGTVTTPISHETVTLTAAAKMPGDMSAVNDVNVGVDTSYAKKIAISNGQIVLATKQGQEQVPVGVLDMLRSVNVQVDGLDLAKTDALLNVLSAPPPPPPGAKVVVQIPPPVVTSGTASLQVDVSRSGNTTTAKVSHVLVHGLAMKSQGSATSWPNDVTADLSASVETRPNATADLPISQQLLQASVTSLNMDSGIGTTVALTENKPIVITNLDNPSKLLVQGGVEIDGDVAQAARVAETFGGAKANAYPYQGHFHLSQVISKQADQPRLYVTGGGTITNFVVMSQPGANGPNSPAQQVFAENNVTIKNPLVYDFDSFSVIIDKNNPIAVVLNLSGALGVTVSGTISDLPLRRQIADDNPVSLTLSYDLAKIWPIIKPLLSPSQQQTFADLQISGKQTRSFVVTGSYPADKPSSDAIAMLKATGNFTVDSVSTNGVSVQTLDVPVYLNNGVAQIVYADGKLPQPASCNGGTLDIGGMQLDMRSMLLSCPRATQTTPVYVMNGATINPIMAKNVIGKILNNPAFVGAKDAVGQLTVRATNLSSVPLTNLSDSTPQNKGTAVIIYGIKGLRLGSQLFSVFGNDSVAADINEANVKYAKGQVATDTTLMINGNAPFRMAGTIILANNQFAPMTVYIPAALFAKAVPGQYRDLVKDQTVVVPMKGDMTRPQIDLGQAIAETIKQGAPKAILNGIFQQLQKKQ
jgi:hypothetical protein